MNENEEVIVTDEVAEEVVKTPEEVTGTEEVETGEVTTSDEVLEAEAE